MAPSATSPVQPTGPIGPESLVKVSTQYYFQQEIDIRLVAVGSNAQREEQYRILGIQLLHDVRNALQLPAQTFTCAARYYHRFRLDHKDNDYQWQDAAIAALLCACKIEDTLKKSRDILCAVHNLKSTDQLSPDDPRFEAPSKIVTGLERLMLESSKFDFRNRTPHKYIIKTAKYARLSPDITKLALSILNDAYKTWAPMKQTCITMALACLELACRLYAQDVEKIYGGLGPSYEEFAAKREDVMETLLDITELYTHNQRQTTVGPMMDVDDFIQLRIVFNKEMEESGLERFCHGIDPATALAKCTPKTPITPASPAEMRANGGVNGNGNMASPVTLSPRSAGSRGLIAGTVRFMLDKNQAREEEQIVDTYHKVEFEEYEVEVEEPIPVTKHERGPGGYRGGREYGGYHGKRGGGRRM